MQDLQTELRDEPLAFWNVPDIQSVDCPCCDQTMSHISSYPFHSSAKFARQLVLWCQGCGFGLVPDTSFSLSDYYRTEYAIDNRNDRAIPPEDYFAAMDSADPPRNLKRYVARAKDQLRRIRKIGGEIGAMLDVGAGPGYALRVSEADEKFAIEYDKHSRKYLDHIGARVIDWDTVEKHGYDAVLLSHSMEHFEYRDLLPRLKMLAKSLNPGGVLYAEVPCGGLGWKNYNSKQEPHTLFFTPEALFSLGRKLGLKMIIGKPLARSNKHIEDLENPIYEPEPGSPFDSSEGRITLIARKPEDG
ncbi:MAG: methyltransferase domain-containing protein [Pseudomonadota bacterium]